MAAVPDLGTTFGALYVGAIVSTVLFGFTSNQAYVYFKKYNGEDALSTRALVVILWLFDCLQTGLMVDMSWAYLVRGYANPLALSVLVWSFGTELGVTVFVTFVVRCFYMKQLWGLSSRNVYILGPAMIFALGQLALGIQTSIHMGKAPSIRTVTTEDFQWILGSKCVCSVIADILITTATCYYLHAARTGFHRTNDLIKMLSVYTINRGVLAMLWETIVMITFLTMKTNFIFAALHLMLGKLHMASLLALLNHRETLRVRGTPQPSTFSHLHLAPKQTRHSTSASQEREQSQRNVEVLVTSETVVDNVYRKDADEYSQKAEKDLEAYPYRPKPIAW
ncbi:hypothetical protein K439DRAFT_1662836 [Ramaria rubella]|nr:hypothetical protein K439DRAFT_1662836 [Ramaria rubella]